MLELDELAPGVLGYTSDLGEKGLYIPLIWARTPGNGDVARYLDSLPRDRRVVVPTVISAKLAGMLTRRGFQLTREWVEEFEEEAEVYERLPHRK